MSKNNNSIFNFSLTGYKDLFPELTPKQWRVVVCHCLSVDLSVLASEDNSSKKNLEKLLDRACEKLNIKRLELRSVVILRVLFFTETI